MAALDNSRAAHDVLFEGESRVHRSLDALALATIRFPAEDSAATVRPSHFIAEVSVA
ncbi:MAG: hypothetical protein JO060_01365 [Candidatus Eremiobacteraeota bacterium]|nr:hypothetical protein [Candidatus Eremiobacteraeota bacterium]